MVHTSQLSKMIPTDTFNQKPRCKQRGIRLAALQGSGVFDPRGIRQITMRTWLFSSLPAGINNSGYIKSKKVRPKNLLKQLQKTWCTYN